MKKYHIFRSLCLIKIYDILRVQVLHILIMDDPSKRINNGQYCSTYHLIYIYPDILEYYPAWYLSDGIFIDS